MSLGRQWEEAQGGDKEPRNSSALGQESLARVVPTQQSVQPHQGSKEQLPLGVFMPQDVK